ncbi:unnamed protein product [Rangifer tarandus platyrhynchus]|uniref:Uncharacterized protein n=1 Tax=Rangifer tarandus platyrhynchus TaxID=3082113 RepID=A0ACB1KEY3_RANTA
MPLGPGYQPIDSPSSTLNRPLCCECPNVRQGEGTRTLQGEPPARSFSSRGRCLCPFGAVMDPDSGLAEGCMDCGP